MHPSMDFPKSAELSEIVRQYAFALILASQKPRKAHTDRDEEDLAERSYGDITAESIGVELEFGKVDASAINERVKNERSAVRVHNRAVDKRKRQAEESKGRRTVDPSEIIPEIYEPPSQAELAALAEQAKLALAEAGKLAGEPVEYCCAAIRKVSKHECSGNYRGTGRYRAVRALL